MQPISPELELRWTTVSLASAEAAAAHAEVVDQSPNEASSLSETFGVESQALIGVNLAMEDVPSSSDCRSNMSLSLGWDSLPFSSFGSWSTQFDENSSSSLEQNQSTNRKVVQNMQATQTTNLSSNLVSLEDDQTVNAVVRLRHRHKSKLKKLSSSDEFDQAEFFAIMFGVDDRVKKRDYAFDSIPEDAKERYCDYLFDTKTCPHPELRDILVQIHQIKQDRGEERQWTTQENQLMQAIRYTALFASRCNHAAARMASRTALDSLLTALQAITENTNRNIIPIPRNGRSVLECLEKFPPDDARNYIRIYFYSWECTNCKMDYFQYYSWRLPTICPTPGCASYLSRESIRLLCNKFVENPHRGVEEDVKRRV